MNINATLILQSMAMFIFVWFCMQVVWPPILKALDERRTRIADGLAAAEHGKHEQEMAEERAKEILMRRRRIDGEDAFRWIQKRSMDSRKPLRHIADAIILSEDIALDR